MHRHKKHSPKQTNTTTKTTMAQVTTKKATSRTGKKGRATNEWVSWADLTKVQNGFTKDLERIDTTIDKNNEELTTWNDKSDTNITALLERVGKLEEGSKAKESESLEGVIRGVVKAELDVFITGPLTTILEENIKKRLVGQELTDMVGGIIKTLLGTKGKNDTILSVGKVKRQGNMKSVEELMDDPNGFYKSCINVYVSIFGWCLWCLLLF